MTIQLFVPTYHVEECLSEIRECLENGWTGLGYKTVEFENKWKEYTGLCNAHYISSATVGLSLALKIFKMRYGWEDEDEIITTPLTFVSTNHAIIYEQLKPIFADIDQYLCLDPADVKRKITQRTRAVLYVGLGGNTGKYEEIVELCRANKLKLIVDAAHMAGTRLHNETPGKDADVVVYSFQAVKNLPTADSGMICFKEVEHDELCRKLTWLGINKDTYARTNEKGVYKWKYDVEYVGYKYHGNSIMASLGLVQLRYLEEDNTYRRKIVEWYNQAFSGYEDIIKPIPTPKECTSSSHLYIIEVDHRDDLLNALNEKGVYPGVHYRDNTEYQMYAYGKGSCPNSHRMSQRIISLPLHVRLVEEDIKFIAVQVIHFLSMRKEHEQYISLSEVI